MQIYSLRKEQNLNSIDNIFGINGAIRSITIISAYTDLFALNELLNFLEDNYDTRVYPTLRIFLDSSSSGFFTDKKIYVGFTDLNNRIAKFCDELSGIYLVKWGSLFHSKCYLIKSNNYGKVIMGSLNLTKKGFTKNEEIVLMSEFNVNGRSKVNIIAKWIDDEYIGELLKKSQKISENTAQHSWSSCLRHLLLDGNIYYELKEQDPFRFKLHLPEDLIKQKAELDPLLESTISDSISIKILLSSDEKFGGMGLSFPQKQKSKKSWKRYCVETCYGFWNPLNCKGEIEAVLDERKKARKPYYDSIKKVLNKKKVDVSKSFYTLIDRIRNNISKDYPDWKFNNKEKVQESWEAWYEILLEKINDNEKYYERLVSGITHVATPDVWSDPLSSREFEDSFLESLQYDWSKEYNRESSNIIAKSIARNIELEEDRKIPIDQLREKIEHWLNSNPELSLIDFNE